MYTSHMSFQMLSSSETLPISFTPKIHAWLFVRTRKSSIAGDASSIVLKQPEKKNIAMEWCPSRPAISSLHVRKNMILPDPQKTEVT